MGASSKHRQGVAGLAFNSELLRLGEIGLDWIDGWEGGEIVVLTKENTKLI